MTAPLSVRDASRRAGDVLVEVERVVVGKHDQLEIVLAGLLGRDWRRS